MDSASCLPPAGGKLPAWAQIVLSGFALLVLVGGYRMVTYARPEATASPDRLRAPGVWLYETVVEQGGRETVRYTTRRSLTATAGGAASWLAVEEVRGPWGVRVDSVLAAADLTPLLHWRHDGDTLPDAVLSFSGGALRGFVTRAGGRREPLARPVAAGALDPLVRYEAYLRIAREGGIGTVSLVDPWEGDRAESFNAMAESHEAPGGTLVMRRATATGAHEVLVDLGLDIVIAEAWIGTNGSTRTRLVP